LARQVVGDAYCVVNDEGQPIVAAPLPKWLADLIALAPDMVTVVRSISRSAHSIKADEDGYWEFDLPSEVKDRLESVARSVEIALAGTKRAQRKSGERADSRR
jgi:hypothetical protein